MPAPAADEAEGSAVRIVPCAEPAELARLRPAPGLDRFRPPAKQLAALVDIASDPRGCVAAAVLEGELVGYAAFHPPTEVETWGADATGELIELGAVEVAPEHRGKDIARRLLQAALGGGRFDSTVVFATLYAWHYDLPRSGMTDLAYRRMLERLYRSVGLQAFATSDEEVRSSAANALMARIGPAAPAHVVEEFHRLRKAAPEPARSAW